MAGIQAASGVTGPIQPSRLGQTSQGNGQANKSGFGQALKGMIDNVDVDQRSSTSAIQDLIAGKSKDILPVVQAVAKADLSFKLLMGVRNKVIEAYQQTMRMQV